MKVSCIQAGGSSSPSHDEAPRSSLGGGEKAAARTGTGTRRETTEREAVQIESWQHGKLRQTQRQAETDG
eukprot:2126258-Pyramimonas_sp.AAC.2